MTALEHTRRLEHRSGYSRGPGSHGLIGRLRDRRAQREYEASVVAFANALRGVSIPLHPGAARFYREQGMAE